MIIVHHNDADGRCSAAIMKEWAAEDVRFVEMDYKDNIDPAMADGQRIVVLDFSFKPDIMSEIRRRSKEVIWCDHHATAERYGYNDLPGVRDFNDKSLCGAECTFKFCYPDHEFPSALKLLGDYDSWRMELGQRTFEFYEGLKLENTNPADHNNIWMALLFNADSENLVKMIEQRGATAIKYRNSHCARIASSYGYETSIDGNSAFAVNIFGMGNQGIPAEIRNRYPICIAYIHDGINYTVSLYSTTIDVGVIAKNLGGGGHKEAAGFVCQILPFKK